MCWKPNPNSGNVSWLSMSMVVPWNPTRTSKPTLIPRRWTSRVVSPWDLYLGSSSPKHVCGRRPLDAFGQKYIGKLNTQKTRFWHATTNRSNISNNKELGKNIQHHEIENNGYKVKAQVFFLFEGQPMTASCSVRATVYARRFTLALILDWLRILSESHYVTVNFQIWAAWLESLGANSEAHVFLPGLPGAMYIRN